MTKLTSSMSLSLYARSNPHSLIKGTLSFLLLGGDLKLNELMVAASRIDWMVSILISSFEVEHARGRAQSQLIAYFFSNVGLDHS